MSGNALKLLLKSQIVILGGGTYNDGLSGAPTGTAQYPTYLDNSAITNALGVAIPNRPTGWNVPGVDYPTGYPSGQTFKDITNSADRAAYLPANASFDSANDRIIMGAGSAIVLDGWNLGHYSLYSDGGAPAVIVKNSKWKAVTGHNASFLRYHPAETNGTDGPVLIQYSEIDGNLITGDNLSEIIKGGGGGVTVEYCNVKNLYQDFINAYSLSGCPYFILRYNTVVNTGSGIDSNAWLGHCDVFQTLNSNSGSNTQTGHWSGIEIYGNLVVQQTADASNYPVAMNSFVRFGDTDGKNILDPKIHHNVIIGLGNNHQYNNAGSKATTGSAFINVWQWNSIGPTEADGDFIRNLECHDNYYFSDDSGRNATDRCINGYFYQGSSPGISYTFSNNVKMWDGTTFPTTLP